MACCVLILAGPLQVAQERQQQLLFELEAEDRAAADRDAKKAKDALKKKEKKKWVVWSL